MLPGILPQCKHHITSRQNNSLELKTLDQNSLPKMFLRNSGRNSLFYSLLLKNRSCSWTGPIYSKDGLCYPPNKSLSCAWRSWIPSYLSLWIVIYPMDSAIQCLNNRGQGCCYIILKKFSRCRYIQLLDRKLNSCIVGISFGLIFLLLPTKVARRHAHNSQGKSIPLNRQWGYVEPFAIFLKKL